MKRTLACAKLNFKSNIMLKDTLWGKSPIIYEIFIGLFKTLHVLYIAVFT